MRKILKSKLWFECMTKRFFEKDHFFPLLVFRAKNGSSCEACIMHMCTPLLLEPAWSRESRWIGEEKHFSLLICLWKDFAMEEFEQRADEAEKRLAALEAMASVGASSIDVQKYEYQILMLKRAYDRHEKQVEDLNKVIAQRDAEIAALKAK